MRDSRFQRTIEELEPHACKWWPREVREEPQKISVLHTLLDTQEKFLSILKLADRDRAEQLFELLDASGFAYNLFLKHLAVLTDFGSEPLQRVNRDFGLIFPEGRLEYDTGTGVRAYEFQALPVKGALNNLRMKTDTVEHLTGGHCDRALCRDVIMLLLYGAGAAAPSTKAVLFKCTPYEYLGDGEAIDRYVQANYIRVSSIIRGKTATDLGNVAQQYVVAYLAGALGEDYHVKSNGTVPGVTQNEGATLISFDLVVDRRSDTGPNKHYVAIEVTFQETTNSTIERKSGQAQSRYEKMDRTQNFIAYIIDGAGNFTRQSAVRVLCANSHCTVAYTPEELELLLEFIKEKLG